MHRIVALLLYCLVWPVAAEVTEQLTYQTYRVEVREGEALTDALSRSTPIRKWFFRRFHWHIAWQLQWAFAPEALADGRCGIASGGVDLASEITLPELVEGDALSRERFAVYLEALREHELGHHRIALAAAQQIDESIRGLAPAADCEALLVTANAMAKLRLEQAREEEKRYDSETSYGRTQGAWLPK